MRVLLEATGRREPSVGAARWLAVCVTLPLMLATCAPAATRTATLPSTAVAAQASDGPTMLAAAGTEARITPEPVALAPESAAPTRADPFEMTFVGDVMFGRYRAEGFDPIPEGELELFAEITAVLGSSLAVGNLETPLVHELPEASPIRSPARFGADARMAQHLVRAGFDAVSVANNHAYDLRRAGIEQTPEILDALGIVALGSALDEPPVVRVQTIERDGWRVGLIAIATRLNGPKPPRLPSIPLVRTVDLRREVGPVVKAARADHDLMVVLVHWGEEYRATPTAAQRSAAHALVDAGVDVVVGHHPHVLQGVERYRGGVIAYSMGNFSFDNAAEVQRRSGVLRIRARDHRCIDTVVFHPVLIERTPIEHPVPATGDRSQPIKDRMRTLSEPWGTHWVEEGDSLVLDAPNCS